MTFHDLNKAILSAHRGGDFRLADDLETERAQRMDAARQRDEMKTEREDNSRRSFRG